MSFTNSPQVSRSGAPTATDDSSQGFLPGDLWVDTSPVTPVAYSCLDASVGAAVWRRAGGVTNHTGLSNLSWALSGHDGTQYGVAAFNASNVAAIYAPVTDGSVLAFSGSVLAWTSPPQPSIAVGERTYDVFYQPATLGTDSGDVAAAYTFTSELNGVVGSDSTSVTGTVV
jgi:hypothetical protein